MTMHRGRHIVYWLLVLSGLPWLAARLNRRKVLVLVYHGVHAGRAEPVLNFDGMHVRARRFAASPGPPRRRSATAGPAIPCRRARAPVSRSRGRGAAARVDGAVGRAAAPGTAASRGSPAVARDGARRAAGRGRPFRRAAD